MIPAVLNIRLDDTAPPPDDQVPVPFIVTVCPVITPVPVQVKLPPTFMPLVARVRVTAVATDKLPLIVVACDSVNVDVTGQFMFAQVLVESVNVHVPAILRVDPVSTIVPAV
jgi:hypothetical protein